MNWLRRLLPTRFTQEFIPTEEQQKRRTTLARVIRMWMSREHELEDPSVVIEIASSEWRHGLAGTNETPRDKFFDDCYHHLHHYFSDGDVRKVNPEYAKQQRTTLKNCIKKLEGNQD